jgi:Glycosyl transferase family 11.
LVFEKISKNKECKYHFWDLTLTSNTFFLVGNFESEKYFLNYRDELLNEFKIKNSDIFINNKYLNLINNKNVISICVRQNRFSERIKNMSNKKSILKSQLFVKETVDYVYKSISYFDKIIKDPIYLVWSNDFTGLEKYFKTNKFIFVENHNDKALTDFYLLTQCKYFIVGPSTFHWWGAWLSSHRDKICLRPKNLNPSKNIDFWPEKWISI